LDHCFALNKNKTDKNSVFFDSVASTADVHRHAAVVVKLIAGIQKVQALVT
jgi:hypothetical protein